MTAFVFALQRVGALQPGFQASDWTIGKAKPAYLRDLTATC